jgi:hypothetical protein
MIKRKKERKKDRKNSTRKNKPVAINSIRVQAVESSRLKRNGSTITTRVREQILEPILQRVKGQKTRERGKLGRHQSSGAERLHRKRKEKEKKKKRKEKRTDQN